MHTFQSVSLVTWLPMPLLLVDCTKLLGLEWSAMKSNMVLQLFVLIQTTSADILTHWTMEREFQSDNLAFIWFIYEVDFTSRNLSSVHQVEWTCQNFCTSELDDFIEGVKLVICEPIAVIFLLMMMIERRNRGNIYFSNECYGSEKRFDEVWKVKVSLERKTG